MKRKHTAHVMNRLGRERTPFLFILDYELKNPVVLPLHEVNYGTVLYDFNGTRNYIDGPLQPQSIILEKFPVPYETYLKSFHRVMHHLRYGNTYLTNLTFPTRITMNLSLKDVFFISQAKYKIWFNDLFTVFSPEIFVRIRGGRIYSHPMKGTIDASLPDAEKTILEDGKELAEHYTIVDLIRNDLSMVATQVAVDKFRYIERLSLPGKDLLQVSSMISGNLPPDYRQKIGDILVALLPAGSISGAPKKKTMEIIRCSESCERGYYTGIAGYFDGNDLDSCVMIRFIEKSGQTCYFRSGGGITVNSDPKKEYQELIDKVNVPVV